MSFLISVLTGFKYLERRSDDDVVDKLHYSFTTNILIGLSILVSWKQFGGKPIECMTPDQFPQPWEQYVENYCWAQDTYFLPEQVHLGLDHQMAIANGQISYYQWVPFYLIFSSMTFQLPYLMWKFLSGRSGIKLSNLIQHASDPKNVMPDVRPNTIQWLSKHLENAFQFHRRLYKKNIVPHKILRIFNLPYTMCYVTLIYLLVKVFYLANVIFNFLIMNYFLNGAKQTDLYGWTALKEILNGTEWHNSGFFPRVTICDFKARVMGQIQQHSVQCVLVINIFNEKIFVFLWFWYHILLMVSAFSFIYWAFVSLLPCFTKGFVARHLELADMPFDPKESAKDVDRFVDGYLRTDGVFVVRMISMHTGVIFTSDIVASLWKSFFGVEQLVQKMASTASRWPPMHSLSTLTAKSKFTDAGTVSKLDEPDSALKHRTTAPGKLSDQVESGYKSDTERSKLFKQMVSEEDEEDEEENFMKSKLEQVDSDGSNVTTYYSATSSIPETERNCSRDSPYAKVPSSPIA